MNRENGIKYNLKIGVRDRLEKKKKPCEKQLIRYFGGLINEVVRLYDCEKEIEEIGITLKKKKG